MGEKCVWVWDTHEKGGSSFYWKVGCGNYPLFSEADFPFCPYCRRDIDRRDLLAEFKEWRAKRAILLK